MRLSLSCFILFLPFSFDVILLIRFFQVTNYVLKSVFHVNLLVGHMTDCDFVAGTGLHYSFHLVSIAVYFRYIFDMLTLLSEASVLIIYKVLKLHFAFVSP